MATGSASAEAVDRIVAAGRDAWPGSAALAPALRPRIAARLAGEDRPEQLDGAEVYLACACATGDPAALALFERTYVATVPPALSRLSLGKDDIAEVMQTLRIRLFVSEGGAPARVLRYAGAGQLGGLVRVAAIRIGLNLLRSRGKLQDGDDGMEELPVANDDPELAELKAQCRSSFKAAFEDAIASLEPRERSLLDLALVKGMSVDKIGVVYGVHRATAARWVAQARANLTRELRSLLGVRIGVPAAQVDDLLPLVESQIELSLERVLRSRTGR